MDTWVWLAPLLAYGLYRAVLGQKESAQRADAHRLTREFKERIDTPRYKRSEARRQWQEGSWSHSWTFELERMRYSSFSAVDDCGWDHKYLVSRFGAGNWWLFHVGTVGMGAADGEPPEAYWHQSSDPHLNHWLEEAYQPFVQLFADFPGLTPRTTAEDFARSKGILTGPIWQPPRHATLDEAKASYAEAAKRKADTDQEELF